MGWITCGAFAAGVVLVLMSIGIGYDSWVHSLSWGDHFSHLFLMAVTGIPGLSLIAAAYSSYDMGYTPEVRKVISTIDMVESQKRYVEHSSRFLPVRQQSSYTVVDNVVNNQRVYIARNDQTGLYDVIINGKLLRDRATGPEAGKAIMKHFRVNPKTMQRGLPPADGKSHGFDDLLEDE